MGCGSGSGSGSGFGGAVDNPDITEPISFFARIPVKFQLEKKNNDYTPTALNFRYFIFASSQVDSTNISVRLNLDSGELRE